MKIKKKCKIYKIAEITMGSTCNYDGQHM